MVTNILLCVLFTILARYVVVEDCKGVFGEKYVIRRAKRAQHIRVLSRFWYIYICLEKIHVACATYGGVTQWQDFGAEMNMH